MKKKKLNTPSKELMKSKKAKPSKEEIIESDPELKNIISKGVVLPPTVIPTGRKLKPKEKVHYVNGKEFEEEIRAYYKSGFVTKNLERA